MRLDDLHDDADWCQQCGAKLPCDAYWGRRRFCSLECRRRAEGRRVGQERAEALAERRCDQCGGPIPLDRQAGALYCSDACRKAYFRKLRADALAEDRAALRCQVCGRSLAHLSMASARYCSRRCHSQAERDRKRARTAPERQQRKAERARIVAERQAVTRRQRERACLMCGTVFYAPKSPDQKTCSSSCGARWRILQQKSLTCEAAE